MSNYLTTYQIYLILLGYLAERHDDTAMLKSMLIELFKRADKTEIDKDTPKIGHWVRSIYSEEDKDVYKCSYCGRELEVPVENRGDIYIDYPYCHCGAKMIEPQESEDV